MALLRCRGSGQLHDAGKPGLGETKEGRSPAQGPAAVPEQGEQSSFSGSKATGCRLPDMSLVVGWVWDCAEKSNITGRGRINWEQLSLPGHADEHQGKGLSSNALVGRGHLGGGHRQNFPQLLLTTSEFPQQQPLVFLA